MEDSEQKDVGAEEAMISESQVEDEGQNGHVDEAAPNPENQVSDEMVAETTKKDDEDDRKLFVGGLSWETNEDSLRSYLSKYGEISDCVIKVDMKSGRSRGFGFVIFKTVAGLEGALKERPHTLNGKEIDSKLAVPQRRNKVERKLFVGGVKPETSEETIREYFTKFGEIATFERPYDQMKNQPKGFCFLTFKKEGCVSQVAATQYHDLDGKQVECKFADPPSFYGSGGGRGRGGRGGGWGEYSGWNAGYGGMGYGSGMPYNNPYFGGDGFAFQGPAYGSFSGAAYGGGTQMGFSGGYGGGYDGGAGGYGGGLGKQGRGRRGTNFRPY